jgi:hypothetical protein
VYGVEPISLPGTGVISPNAVANIENALVWMSPTGFYAYDGMVRKIPCEVKDYIYGNQDTTGNLNLTQLSKIYAGVNSKKYEVTWFYPSGESLEIDSYVTMNYENWPNTIWYFGTLARTVWIDGTVFDTPIAVDADGNVWAHEVGYTNNGAARSGIFAESGPSEIDDGAQVIYGDGVIPDGDNLSYLNVSFKCKLTPQGATQTYGPISMAPNSYGFIGQRFAGRQVAVRYDQVTDGPWKVGTNRVMVRGKGKR